MGGAVGVHPLVVIFALLAAAQIYGFAGVLVALPLVAVGREVVAVPARADHAGELARRTAPGRAAGRGRGGAAPPPEPTP